MPPPRHNQGMADPWWQRWFLPERPGVRQFALGAAAMLLPVPAVLLGPYQVIPAMAVGITVGVGLGLGWLVLFAVPWLRRAPIAALGVFAVCFGCLIHVEVLPRWEMLLRLQATKGEMQRWGIEHEAGLPTPLPDYRRGEDRPRCAAGRPGTSVIAYTPMPLQRWSPFGWRDNAYLVLRAKGEVVTVWARDRDQLQRILEGR